MTDTNRSGMLLAFAAALILSGCGGAGEKAAVNKADTAATPGGNAAGPATVAGGAANAAPADATAAAAPQAPANVGGANTPGATPGGMRVAGGQKPAAAEPKPQIGSGGNDFYLFTKARGALSADAELKASNVVVEVKEGVGTLSGTVASEAQKSKAERLAMAAGIKSVKNQLRVSAAK